MHSVTRLVHQSSGGRSMMFDCEGPVNAITTNKDANLVVAAGRTVFRIVAIEDGHFEERLNLRVGKAKSFNLNYSAADVAWNHQDENILASAATNGSVVIWDLNRPSRSKQEHVFSDHKRSVNRVNFHSGEQQLLISGSQDGNVMLFDVRKRAVSSRFVAKGSESVRDVQFCPNNYFTFGATYDNGNVQIWDMRRPDRYESVFTAHSGPVFSHDWHPEDKNWVATAGRDKLIRVWDVSRTPAKLMFNIQTIASVARIKWRPQRRYHIASCSLLLDHDVNIWNLHRPYIPFASFDEHKDVTTGIVWKDDNHFFLSCGKDGMLIQHMFKDAKRPADRVVPSGIDVSVSGRIAHASYEKPDASAKSGQIGRKFPFRRQPDRSEQFIQINSNMAVLSVDDCLSMDCFIQAAEAYRLRGTSVGEVCDWNMKVTRSIGLPKVTSMWAMLKIMFGTVTSGTTHSTKLTSATQNTSDKQENEKGSLLKQGNKSTADFPKKKDSDIEKTTADITSGNSEDSSESDSSETREMTDIATGLATKHPGDFFFGDGELDMLGYSIDIVSRLDNPEDWTLPSEAFQPRHEISDRTTPPEQTESRHDSLISGDNDANMTSRAILSESEETDVHLTVSNITGPNIVSVTTYVAQLLRECAEQGDVQTPVSVLLVVGERVTQALDIQTQENWFLCYIELLGRYKLWSKANEVIKLSHLPQIKYLNQESTCINNICAKCSRPLQGNRRVCERCRIITNICSICHHPVKGLFAWCQGCCHGGHLQHLKEWFKISKHCPTGCGHLCEYT